MCICVLLRGCVCVGLCNVWICVCVRFVLCGCVCVNGFCKFECVYVWGFYMLVF